MKKKFLCPALAACLLFAQVQPASAPTPLPIILILKCSAMLGLGEGAWLIYSCEPKSYLVRITDADGAVRYIASNKALRTLKKDYDKVIRCEGPMTKEKAEQRAWENNGCDPQNPMWPCGPLGNCPTVPTYTNWTRITLTQSVSGGGAAALASVVIDPEDQWSFAVLPATGTNNLSPGVLAQVMDTDARATNTSTAGTGLVAFGGTIEEIP